MGAVRRMTSSSSSSMLSDLELVSEEQRNDCAESAVVSCTTGMLLFWLKAWKAKRSV